MADLERNQGKAFEIRNNKASLSTEANICHGTSTNPQWFRNWT